MNSLEILKHQQSGLCRVYKQMIYIYCHLKKLFCFILSTLLSNAKCRLNLFMFVSMHINALVPVPWPLNLIISHPETKRRISDFHGSHITFELVIGSLVYRYVHCTAV